MGDEGLSLFAAASGLDDWRLLDTGPAAYFHTGTLAHSVELAGAIASLDDVEAHPPVLEVRSDGVTIRLVERPGDLEEWHVEAARAISYLGRELGARPDPSRLGSASVHEANGHGG